MQGVFHMVLWKHIICGGHFLEKERYTLDDTMKGKSHMGVTQFWRGCLTTTSQVSPQLFRAPILAPILQDSALDKKNSFSP